MFTDEQLVRRVSAVQAVDEALSTIERGAFHEHVLTGPYGGATPADWIDDALDGDAFLPQIELWWETDGEAAVNYLTKQRQLPEEIIRNLITAALYAACALKNTDIVHRSCVELADAAALWVRGHAHGLGWQSDMNP